MLVRPISTRAGAILVALFSLVFYSLHLSNRPVCTRGEGREVLVVKNMFEQRNFTMPLRNGEVIPSKPPMFHWLGAIASVALGHLSEFSVRFPSALSAALVLGFLYFIVAHHRDASTALLSVLIASTTFEFSRSATHGRVDMCFTLGLTGALLCLYRNLEIWVDQNRHSWLWLAALTSSTVFAVLAKGPAAVLIVTVAGVILALGMAQSPRIKSLKQFPILPFAIALALTFFLSSIWYWLAYVELGQAFLVKHLWKENVTRLIHVVGETEQRGHLKPFYFSFIHLLLGFLPWSFFMPVVGVVLWRTRKTLLTSERRFEFFLLVWSATLLLAVTLSQSKRIVYLLPAYPALAALLADALQPQTIFRRGEMGSYRSGAVMLGLLWFIVLFALTSIALVVVADNIVSTKNVMLPSDIEGTLHLGRTVAAEYSGFIAVLGAAAVLLLMSVSSAWNTRGVRAGSYLASAMLIAVFAYGQWISPVVAQLNDPRPIMAELNKHIAKVKGNVAAYQLELYPERFYTNVDIPRIASIDTLEATKAGCLFARSEDLPELMARLPNGAVVFRSNSSMLERGHELVLIRYGQQTEIEVSQSGS